MDLALAGKTAVVTGGAAERGGVKVNDVVAAIDDHPVADLGTELAGQALDNEHVTAGQAVKLKLTAGKNAPAQKIARVKGHHWDWLDAIRNGRQAGSNFDYGGPPTPVASRSPLLSDSVIVCIRGSVPSVVDR